MKRALGLTLVEVLVAAVILFAALSLSALALKSLRQNSAQAEKVIKMAEPVRMIVLTVQQQIRAKPEAELTGAGEAFKVSYSWHAAVVKTGSAPSRFDLDAGSITVPPERFRLYLVTLDLTYEGRTQTLQYKELAWLPLQ